MTLEEKLKGGTQYRDFAALEPQDEMVVTGYADKSALMEALDNANGTTEK